MDFVYMGISRNQFLQIYSKEIIRMRFTPVAFITGNGDVQKKYLHSFHSR